MASAGNAVFSNVIEITGPLYDYSHTSGGIGQVLSSTGNTVFWTSNPSNVYVNITSGNNYADYLMWNGSNWVTGGESNVSIGSLSGQYSQGSNAVAIGSSSATNTQGSNAIAIGNNAGNYIQNTNSIAIGNYAGYSNQNSNAVSIGYQAGQSLQNMYSISTI